MKKYLLLILFLLPLTLPASSGSPDAATLRQWYIESVESKENTYKYFELLEDNSDMDPMVLAYKGAFASLMARYVFNPMNKIEYLKLADQVFIEAVKRAPNNIEIRFLRFAYQHYVPGFLGYSDNLEEDRKAMLMLLYRNLNDLQQDEFLYESVVNLLLDSKRCSDEENAKLEELKAEMGE